LKTTPSPTVSICIPAYNQGCYIAQALESAVRQTFADLEVIVSDNCSSDNTREVVEQFAKRDARVRYERAKDHVPIHESFNRCADLARGTYLKFLPADDVLEPRCLDRTVAALERHPEVKLVTCARRIFGDRFSQRVARYASQPVLCLGEEAIRKCYFHGNLIGEPAATLFRRGDFGTGFSDRFVQLVDLHMWFKLLEGGSFMFLPEVLCSIRQHEAQTTKRNIAIGRITEDKERLYADFGGKPYLAGSTAERLLWDFRMAWSAQRERAVRLARQPSEAVYFPALRTPMYVAAGALWQVATKAAPLDVGRYK
jgi:glycosyltransferase involved in cell wall biosynthesis